MNLEAQWSGVKAGAWRRVVRARQACVALDVEWGRADDAGASREAMRAIARRRNEAGSELVAAEASYRECCAAA